MSLFKGTTSFKNFGLLGFGMNLAKDFNEPATEGMSDAERRALNEQRQEEDARRRRQLEQQQRRTRVALGAVGGSRSLLYGGFTGTSASAPAVQPGVATAPGGATGPSPSQRPTVVV